MENWRLIPEFEGRYEVSDQGNVRSLLDSHLRPKYPKSKTLQKDVNGYNVVSLYYHRKMYLKKVHRLVAILFIPNPNNKPFVNHKNGIKDDNRLENLEWVTAKENSRHAFDTGLHVGLKGEKAGMAIWTDNEVISIKEDINKGLNSTELFDKYPKLNSKHLYLFRANKTFTHLSARVTSSNPKRTSRRTKKYLHLIDDILVYKNTDISQKEIAAKFNLPQTTVSLIYRNEYK